jgi:hypothetical protein
MQSPNGHGELTSDAAVASAPAGVQKLVSAKNFKAIVHVDGQVAEGEVAAITIANAAPPFSVLAHGHTGECIYDGEAGLQGTCLKGGIKH